ncbi:MAG TPA: hypothetical protein VF412_16595 [Bdellovibrio sp.]|uniref:hypothetical protein n=1 Tax=Bdellovibrio sp. TaxID=28201 RepID=UPI002F011419
MLTIIGALIISVSFAQEKTSAVLYDLNSQRNEKLYTAIIESTPSSDGAKFHTVFRDLQGKTALEETGLISGADLKDYTIDRPQTNEKGHIEVRDGKVYFTYEGDGKKKTAEEKVSGDILCPANFSAFVRAHWGELNAGTAVPVRYAVWDRRETVGFTLQKMGESDHEGKKWMELRMKPTSFVIAAIVDPIHLWYAVDSKKLMVMKGRVQVKKQVDGKWKDLDAESVYTYDQNVVSK